MTEEDTFAALMNLSPIVMVDSADLITVKEFCQRVRNKHIKDGDGFGFWATEHYFKHPATLGDLHEEGVYPYQILHEQRKPPQWATHVLWFEYRNRPQPV